MKLAMLGMLLTLLLPLGAIAETIDARLYKNDVCGFHAVLHINGVDTDRLGAQANLAELRFHYGNAHDGHRVRYGLGYNETITQGTDIVQAMYQTIAEFDPYGISFEDWIRAFYRGIYPDWFPADVMASISATLARNFDIRRPDTFYDSDLHLITVDLANLGFHTPQAKLLIVGHSQGSIYANMLYRRLTTHPVWMMSPRQIGLMSIAAFVASPLPGTGSDYVTNANDRPVTMGRFAYSDILPATVTIPHTEFWANPWRGHNLDRKVSCRRSEQAANHRQDEVSAGWS